MEGIHIPDITLLYATVTGDPGGAGYFPMNAVKWLTEPRDLAALVTDSGTDRFEAKLFHFGDQPRRMGAELYLLEPGSYVANLNGNQHALEFTRSTRVDFTIPPGVVFQIQVKRGVGEQSAESITSE